MSKGLKFDQTKVYWNNNIDITKLVGGVWCSYKCFLISSWGYVILDCNKEEWSTNIVYAYKLLNGIKQNYSTTKWEVSTMGFALHKFRHYLLGNK
jgi:hypothetical protein